jgi:hypothetical protein
MTVRPRISTQAVDNLRIAACYHDYANQVRPTPSWPRSWANLSLVSPYPHRNARANLHLLGQPDAVLAPDAPARRGVPAGRGARDQQLLSAPAGAVKRHQRFTV